MGKIGFQKWRPRIMKYELVWQVIFQTTGSLCRVIVIDRNSGLLPTKKTKFCFKNEAKVSIYRVEKNSSFLSLKSNLRTLIFIYLVRLILIFIFQKMSLGLYLHVLFFSTFLKTFLNIKKNYKKLGWIRNL